VNRTALVAALASVSLCLAAAVFYSTKPSAAVSAHGAVAKREVLRGYRRLGHRSFEAAYHSAGQLKTQIKRLLANPSDEALLTARQAWRDAHRDYSRTEVFRFGNWIVDDWETSVNAWPVDEGLLDYVDRSYEASPTNPLARQNLVSQPDIQVGGITISANTLDWAQLKFIHAGSDNESNVVLGYHAIEFLLWGQDLHRSEPGAGQRPWTDYSAAAEGCTSGIAPAPVEHCRRRRQLLQTMAEHLYSQLATMTLDWAGNSPTSYGLHIAEGDVDEGLRRMLFGIIRLAGDEMAGERMRVALLTHAPEEEQDCFSDDTHQSLYNNAVGIQNIYYGHYQNDRYQSGEHYQAPLSLAALARRVDDALADQIDEAILRTQLALSAIQRLGEGGQTFDLLIRPGQPEGRRAIEKAIEALQAQSQLFEQLGGRLGFENSLNPQSPMRRSAG